ncbi:hypothetical protein QTP88_007303 [Uroleucon formosanum]
MATKSLKPKGGSSCAVATCVNYAGKVKRDGNTNISFYRFPKDPEFQKKWTLKCRRGDIMNPGISYMCSEHFSDDAYIRDLKAELLEYTPKFRKLKPDAIPTLNLPEDHTHRFVASTSSFMRRSRMELKKQKQDHDDLITSILTTDTTSFSNVSSSTVMISDDSTLPTKPDYEKMYNELLKKYEVLQNKTSISSQKHELSNKDSVIDYQSINQSLRSSKQNLQRANTLLIKNKKQLTKEIKLLSKNRSRAVDVEAKKYLKTLFSTNQIDLIMKKKKKVHWTTDEISKAFTLMYFSKRAYIYVKDELHYPLPGLSSLQRWATNIDMQCGILEDVNRIMPDEFLKDKEL